MKRYKAITKQGAPITTVHAEDEEEAREKVRRQLDRDGRRGFLLLWKQGGERVREEEG